MLLTVDIGNSSVGMAVFEGDTMINHHVFPKDGFTVESVTFFNQSNWVEPPDIIVASVVPSMKKGMLQMAQELGQSQPVFVDHHLDLGFSLDISNPETLGADRIANCSGGFYLSEPPFIVVDSGTATNLEVVNREGDFIGGSIFPGIDMGMDSMARRAAQLGQVPFHVPESPLGKSTPDCMRSGIYHSQLGGIKFLIEEYKKIVGEDAAVFATGGGMNHFIHDLGENVSHKPHLIFYGMKRIFDRIS